MPFIARYRSLWVLLARVLSEYRNFFKLFRLSFYCSEQMVAKVYRVGGRD